MKFILLLLFPFLIFSCTTAKQPDLIQLESVLGSQTESKYLLEASPLSYISYKQGKNTLYRTPSWILSTQFNTSLLEKYSYDKWRKSRYKDLESIVTVKITFNTNIIPNGPSDIQTGLLILPQPDLYKSKPITWVIWARGTDLARDNAPSTETNYELFLAKLLANLGFGVWMPDYAGSGDSLGPQTYCVPESQALSALDGLNAAREYISYWENLYSETGRLNIIGYSQGGLVSMATGNLVDTNQYVLDNLSVESVFAMGAPLDLMIDANNPLTQTNSPIPRPEFTLSMVIGWARAYPDMIKPNELLKPIVVEKILPYFNGSPSNEELGRIICTTLEIENGKVTYEDLFLPSYLTDIKNNPDSIPYYSLQKSARLNQWIPQNNQKIVLAVSMEDRVVNPENSISAYYYMEKNAYENVEFLKLSSKSHFKAGGESLILGIMLLDMEENPIN